MCPPKLALSLPTKNSCVGVTGVYVPLATSNTFFTSPDHEEGETSNDGNDKDGGDRQGEDRRAEEVRQAIISTSPPVSNNPDYLVTKIGPPVTYVAHFKRCMMDVRIATWPPP